MAGARKALIVASDEYEHEGLRHLRSPQADAVALAGVLGNPQIGDFAVRVVHNQPSYEVQAHIEDLFADAQPDDVLLLHFACHGLKSESGELFFAARNTRLDRLGSTAVAADFVQRCMRASRSRSIVLLLDCCYGGAFSRGVSVRAAGSVNVLDSFPSGRLEGGRGRAVITASNAMEYAFEGDHLADDHSQQTSVFTSALVRGLATGEADRDEDGWVSLNELYDYVFDRIRTQNPSQTPTRDIEMAGELYLARSRRRRVQATPVPPDLAAASADPNMFTRLGAVSELRSRLLGDNVPAAAGAYDRLAEMASHDIQYVAEAAAAALAQADLDVGERELAFGQVATGSPRPRRTVHLAGPPLARACSYEASDSWISVDEVPEGIVIGVDTATPGARHGTVTVKGPTGEAVVTVDVDVTGTPESPAQTAPAPAPEPMAPEPMARPEPVASEPVASGPVARPHPLPAAQPMPVDRDSAAPGRLLRGAGFAALAAAAFLAIALATPFQWDTVLLYANQEVFIHVLVVIGMVGAASAFTLSPTTRWSSGAGLLLGVAAASTWGLVLLVNVWVVYLAPEGGVGSGFWFNLLGHVVLLVVAVLVALALVRARDVQLGPRPTAGLLSWLVLALGVLGAAAMVWHAANQADEEWPRSPTIWVALLAVAMPTVAALSRHRRLAVSLLVGWVVGAAALVVVYGNHVGRLQDEGQTLDGTPVALFGLTVLGLTVLAVLLARAGRTEPVAAPTGATG